MLVFLIVFSLLCVDSLPFDGVKPQLKIIGGYAVRNRGEFPYQVSLRYKGSHFCGGAIIEPTLILTAAHCSFDSNGVAWRMKNLAVVAGDLNIKQSSGNTTIRSVSQVYVHAKYNAKSIRNDIALWQVSSPFLWNEHVQPVQITNEIIPSNTKCNVSGWGLTDYKKDAIDSSLRYVEVPIVQKSYCRTIYPEIDALNVLCAGVMGKDSCQGDSGGALVCNGSLTGIVSYGINCGVYPGVYTDVYAYRSWIGNKIRMISGSSSPSTTAMFLVESIMLVFYTVLKIL